MRLLHMLAGRLIGDTLGVPAPLFTSWILLHTAPPSLALRGSRGSGSDDHNSGNAIAAWCRPSGSPGLCRPSSPYSRTPGSTCWLHFLRCPALYLPTCYSNLGARLPAPFIALVLSGLLAGPFAIAPREDYRTDPGPSHGVYGSALAQNTTAIIVRATTPGGTIQKSRGATC